MRTENSLRYARRIGENHAADNIIYLDDLREPENGGGRGDYESGRSADKTDMFWNVTFIVACLAVLAVLFLH